MLQNTDQTSVVTVTAPASKSLSHRYLIGAAWPGANPRCATPWKAWTWNAPELFFAAAGARMEALDASGNGAGNNSGGWRVQGLGGAPRGGGGAPWIATCCESGTTCRLLTAVLAAR